MNRITAPLILMGLFSFSNINAQYTDVINSNRPGKSMSAFSVGKTKFFFPITMKLIGFGRILFSIFIYSYSVI
jgi:hypothetical protein